MENASLTFQFKKFLGFARLPHAGALDLELQFRFQKEVLASSLKPRASSLLRSQTFNRIH